MRNVIINVDAGEGEPDSASDIALLEYVDAVNIALGAHAGDPDWSKRYADLAQASGKRVHLHPGYPDRAGFGRNKLDIQWGELAASLSQQRSVLPNVSVCKFHGALYNESCIDTSLAEQLIQWCRDEGITEVVTPCDSALDSVAERHGVSVLSEAFADRRYVIEDSRLRLQSRQIAGAVIDDLRELEEQATLLVDHGQVMTANDGLEPIRKPCQTLCIHGDSPQALLAARRLSEWKRNG